MTTPAPRHSSRAKAQTGRITSPKSPTRRFSKTGDAGASGMAPRGGIHGSQPTVPHGSRAKLATSGPGSHVASSSNSRRAGDLGKHVGLRAKFILLLAVVTGVAMVGLGLSMASITHSFLFSQKQHDGIDLARSLCMMGESIADDLMQARVRAAELAKSYNRDGRAPLDLDAQKRIQTKVADYLKRTSDWFGNGDLSFSDILAVRFDCPLIEELHAAGFGSEDENSVIPGEKFNELYDTRTGTTIPINQNRGIEIYAATKNLSNGESLPIYRFKIALNKAYGQTQDGRPANVRVDIAAKSVQQVTINLRITIMIAVMIAIAMVIGVAYWLASTITNPLSVLMRDMKTVASGNLNHETRPRSNDEIGVLATEFNRMTQNLKIAQSALVEQEKAEYELSIAREVQRQLLPAETPALAGYECAAYYHGAKAVSGDYFDFIPLGDRLWGFIIADVSGKGIPGSMVMAVTRTIVRLIANKHRHHAAETLKETNRLISKQIKRGMFVTACYAILDKDAGTLTYASAGHNPIVIYRAATKSYELAQGKGIALGFNEGPIFDKTIQEQSTTLNEGDAFYLYTDGFPEAMNAQNQEYGEEKFYEAIATHGHQDVRACVGELVAEIAGHRGHHEQSDDLTMIVVQKIQSS